MRRFLSTAVGWFALQFTEFAFLFLLARWLVRSFPGLARGPAFAIVVGLAVVLAIANYVIRRRYLRGGEPR